MPGENIPVIDLFAGPGGLGEGFSECMVGGRRPFRIAISIEMDEHAHETLQLRSFYRQYRSTGRKVPEAYYQVLRGELTIKELASRCPETWKRADEEAVRATLGNDVDDRRIRKTIQERLRDMGDGPRVVIGGPPCQAYSLVGRARNKGNSDYIPEADHRHHLYREYLRIITQTWPDVFVMENVKGVLSAKLNGRRIFPKILEDLQDPLVAIKGNNARRQHHAHRYRLVPISNSPRPRDGHDVSDFVVRCEDYGIPQRRHRIFVVGLREDLVADFKAPEPQSEAVTVADVIRSLPKLQGELSRRSRADGSLATSLSRLFTSKLESEIRDMANAKVARMCKKFCSRKHPVNPAPTTHLCEAPSVGNDALANWLIDDQLGCLPNHEARSHMASDLLRYVYASSYALCVGDSRKAPTLDKFPTSLLPNHKNAMNAKVKAPIFNDRFQVQVWDQPASTITSHIAKDGHFFIHPDPEQFRSLTVREAARLQTFPDNYYFCGPRTSQYTQVGNAVPPLMARHIAESIFKFLREAGRI